jgi:hypothetical protein
VYVGVCLFAHGSPDFKVTHKYILNVESTVSALVEFIGMLSPSYGLVFNSSVGNRRSPVVKWNSGSKRDEIVG